MTVDHSARKTVSDAIDAYVGNEIDNFKFDDVLCECRTSDGLCNSLIHVLWFLYDDYSRQQFDRESPAASYFKRWSRLLQTSIDFDEPIRASVLHQQQARSGLWGKINDLFHGKRPAFAWNPYWPLSTADEWKSLGIEFDTGDIVEATSSETPFN